ncbi:MAG: hypothetical protein V2I24_07890, partial [Halieaceae bacterium]|nr:hypothetical protein [Halieaceae bacterium]
MRARARHLLALFLLPGLSGCIATGDTVDGMAACASVDELEDIAKAEAVFVSEPRSVPGFPSLATNRVLAGFDPLVLDEQQRAAWRRRLEDAGARRDAILRAALMRRGIEPPSDADQPSCQPAEPESSVGPPAMEFWQTLAKSTQVPDDYLGSHRALGLYPLAKLPVRLGIN